MPLAAGLFRFFLATFVVSWSCFAGAVRLRAAGTADQLTTIAAELALLVGTFAPALVALALTALDQGRRGVSALLRSIVPSHVSARWYVFAAVFILFIKLLAAGVHRALFGVWPVFGQEPWYLMAIAMVISTPVQAGEEIGWRGYALPRMAASMGLGSAGVVLGVVWAAWHLPLFFLAGADKFNQSLPVYVLQVTALSVVMAWLYWRTGRALLLVMLFHAAGNNTKDVVPSAAIVGTTPFTWHASSVAWITVALLWIVAGTLLVRMRGARLAALVLVLALSASACGSATEPGIVAAGATVEKLAGGFTFTEGPTCDTQGRLFFTDQPNNRIHKWSAEEGLSTFLEPAGRANGLFFAPDGELIACADDKTALWSIAPDRTVRVLAHEYDGKPLNGPNDVWVRPDGAIYFTDPFYKRPWWTYDKMPQENKGVYFLSADRRQLVRAVTDLTQPNGIIGTPDGKTLFVSDIGANRTYRYSIAPDGSLSGKSLVVSQGSDGMTLDNAGHLYLTGEGVMVFDSSSGRLVDRIQIPGEKWTANVSFCGKDRQTLFITASTGLYSIRTRVKGANDAK